ncbi:tetratricopeptide repeat protein [Anabaena sp. CCY 9402-a]|uniref:tetratricopeptide repeat protein n=1 Tax=Anabaena sp. CCY 9402-a TaxID=3103867 RepID=UPI0039C5EBD0
MKCLFIIWVLVLSLVFPNSAITSGGRSPCSGGRSAISTRGCANASEETQFIAQTKQPDTLIPGLGTYRHPVSTQNPQAQKFFDQGLNLIYGFNHDEAVRSFQHAAELDPQMAMAYWGIALALGPNINSVVTSEKEQAAYQAIQTALELAVQASIPERDYIQALAKRYSPNSHADLHQLDVDYAKAMASLFQRYPDDLDAATLYAESLMDLHPWQLWTHDGQPQPGTNKIVVVLEYVLQRNSNHPGANHYYIHAVEASLHPERALESAKRLETLVPAAGHLIHMPGHIYFRVGDYAGAMRVNQQAIAQDEPYICHNQVQGIYPQLYLTHNLHFLMVASSMAGKHKDALEAADKLVAHASSIDPHLPMLEGFLGNKLLMQARFGDWDEILQTPAPDATLPTTNALWHFTRGLAYAAQNKPEDAANESRALLATTQIMPSEATIGFTPASRILDIAQKFLDAKIAESQREYNAAIAKLQQAVVAEDNLDYVEPPDWYFPTREALGGVLLAKGDYAAAEPVFRADLQKYPHNGRSLFGLQKSLQAQGKNRE